jgi:3-(3-hydroxy-phenyl)propionate hydroxylase
MTDVLIVGGGPVGLIAALGMAREGIDVDLIESEDGVVYSPRAMTYASSVLDGLQFYGLLDDMKRAGLLNHERSWRVYRTGEEIVYDHEALRGVTDYPYMMTLGQDRLAEIVLAHLGRYPNVRIHWATRFVGMIQLGDHVVVETESGGKRASFTAKWVVGADGGRSAVRKSLGLKLDGMTWPNRFVATNVFYDFDEYGWHSGYHVDHEFGAVVAQITPEGLWRVTFAEDARLPVETVAERIPHFLRTIMPGHQRHEVTAFSAYNMHQRSASTYRVGRVLLAGDAAHITNPTSGFGLVGGMFDAFLLSEALAAVVRGDVGEDVLDRYSEARHHVFRDFTSPVSSESMRLVFHSDDPVRLENDLAVLRARKDDPEAMRLFLSAASALETPSLLSGKRLVERRKQSDAANVAAFNP